MIGEIAKLNIGRIGGKIAEHHRQCVSVECGIDICDGDDVAGADSRALAAAMPQPDHLVDQSLAPQVSVRIRHSVSRAIIDDDDLQTAAVGEGLLGQTAIQARRDWASSYPARITLTVKLVSGGCLGRSERAAIGAAIAPIT